MQLLTEADFSKLKTENILLLDTRPIEVAAENIFEDALNIPWGNTFLEIFQNIVSSEQPLVVICEEANAVAISKAILGSGFAAVKGYITASELQHENTSVIIVVDAQEFAIDFNYDEFYLIDVRTTEDFEAEFIDGSENIPMDDLAAMSQELSENMRIYVVGATAEQAFTATSLLKRNGVELARTVAATFDEIRETGIPIIKPKKANKTIS